MPTPICHQIYVILEVFSNNSIENISMGFKMYIVNIHTAVIHRLIKIYIYIVPLHSIAPKLTAYTWQCNSTIFPNKDIRRPSSGSLKV